MTAPLAMQHPGPWAAAGMIAAIVLCSTTGEVLTAAAMKSIGDLDEIRAQFGDEGRDSRGGYVPAVLLRAWAFWRWRFSRCSSR